MLEKGADSHFDSKLMQVFLQGWLRNFICKLAGLDVNQLEAAMNKVLGPYFFNHAEVAKTMMLFQR